MRTRCQRPTFATSSPVRVLLLGYAVAVYGYAALFVPYFLAFAGGRTAPPDLGGRAGGALAVDGALLASFAVSHSVMARSWWKDRVRRLLPDAAERSTYVLAACVALTALIVLWAPLPTTVWTVTATGGRTLVDATFACGVLLTYAAAIALGHTELLGLAPAWRWFADLPAVPTRLCERGPYRWIRHPLMLGLVLVFWSAPAMTADRLCFAVAMTVYAVVGTRLEERDLLARHGAAFGRYRHAVAALVPSAGSTRAARERPAVPPAEPSSATGFDFAAAHEVFWNDVSVFKTLLLDAYTVIAPELDRFCADRIRAIIPRVDDAALAERARAFIAAEDAHAMQHQRATRVLTTQGFEIGALRRLVAGTVAGALTPFAVRIVEPTLGPSFGLAVVAGVEHWEAALAEVCVDRTHHPDSEMQRLFHWHGTATLKHRAVAFDLLRACSRSQAMRLAGFLVASLVVGGLWTIGTVVLLAQVRRLAPGGVVRDAARCLLARERILLHGARRFRAYLQPSFHPLSPTAWPRVRGGTS